MYSLSGSYTSSDLNCSKLIWSYLWYVRRYTSLIPSILINENLRKKIRISSLLISVWADVVVNPPVLDQIYSVVESDQIVIVHQGVQICLSGAYTTGDRQRISNKAVIVRIHSKVKI